MLAILSISADTAAIVLGALAAGWIAAQTARSRLQDQLDHDTLLREREATRERSGSHYSDSFPRYFQSMTFVQGQRA